MELPKVSEQILGRKVFLRGDIDVPLADGTINDPTRLEAIWPTVQLLLQHNCRVILAGHLGRPEGKVVPELSSQPVATWFCRKLGGSVVSGQSLGDFQAYIVSAGLTVLENLRFWPGEEANDEAFARQLADLAEVYVNDSFAESHRAAASIVGVPKFLPHYAGLRLTEEVAVLTEVLESPKRPMVAVIAGAKLETKIPVITKMSQVADTVIVGGKLLSEVRPDTFSDPKIKLLALTESGKDSTLESVDSVVPVISAAGTIVWNGPVGLVEDFTYQVGTRRLAETIAASTAFKVVGGGDTSAFLAKLGLLSKFDWVSVGGGAMLAFLSGEQLPGLEALAR